MEPQNFQSPFAGSLSFFSRHRRLLWIGAVSLAVLTAGLVVYLVFFRGEERTFDLQGEVGFSVTAPAGSVSGSEISYELIVENRTNARIADLTVETFYPPGFTFLDAAPDAFAVIAGDPSSPRTFRLTALERGQQHRLIIVGRLEGSLQDVKAFSARLRYVPENLSSAFVAEAEALTAILAPEIAFRLAAPAQIVSGQNVAYELKLTNLADNSFRNIIVEMTFPEGFEYQASSRPPRITPPAGSAPGRSSWLVETLEVGESETIAVTGKIFGDAGRESFAAAELMLQNSQGQLVSGGRSFALTQILPSPLVISHRIRNLPEVVLPGNTLQFEVDYENVGNVSLNNVTISVLLETPAFDFQGVRSQTGQLRPGPNGLSASVVWIPAQARELLVVSPRQRGSFTFEAPVASDLEAKLLENPRLISRVQYTARELSEPLNGNALNLQVSTRLEVRAVARVIAGSNPPQAGQTSTYEVELVVDNGVNDVSGAELTAVVPGLDAVFVEDSLGPAGERPNASYVPATRTIRWRMGRIFAFTGSFHEERRLTFQIEVTPTGGDPFSRPPLLREIEVSGTDEFTQKKAVSNRIETLPR